MNIIPNTNTIARPSLAIQLICWVVFFQQTTAPFLTNRTCQPSPTMAEQLNYFVIPSPFFKS